MSDKIYVPLPCVNRQLLYKHSSDLYTLSKMILWAKNVPNFSSVIKLSSSHIHPTRNRNGTESFNSEVESTLITQESIINVPKNKVRIFKLKHKAIKNRKLLIKHPRVQFSFEIKNLVN